MDTNTIGDITCYIQLYCGSISRCFFFIIYYLFITDAGVLQIQFAYHLLYPSRICGRPTFSCLLFIICYVYPRCGGDQNYNLDITFYIQVVFVVALHFDACFFFIICYVYPKGGATTHTIWISLATSKL